MDLSHELNGGHRVSKQIGELSSKSGSLSSSASTTVIGSGSTRSRITSFATGTKNLTASFSLKIEAVEFRLRTETGAPVEPYYLSLALYDVKNGKKISEDFHATVDMDGSVVGNIGVR